MLSAVFLVLFILVGIILLDLYQVIRSLDDRMFSKTEKDRLKLQDEIDTLGLDTEVKFMKVANSLNILGSRLGYEFVNEKTPAKETVDWVKTIDKISKSNKIVSRRKSK